MDSYHPEYVIVEKVERNLDDFALDPPIVTGSEKEFDSDIKKADVKVDLDMKEAEYDTDYWSISGVVPDSLPKDTKIYIQLTQGDQTTAYEAFTVSNDESDYGYLLYLSKSRLTSGPVEISVIVDTKDGFQCVKTENFDTTQIGNIDTDSVN